MALNSCKDNPLAHLALKFINIFINIYSYNSTLPVCNHIERDHVSKMTIKGFEPLSFRIRGNHIPIRVFECSISSSHIFDNFLNVFCCVTVLLVTFLPTRDLKKINIYKSFHCQLK